MPGSLDEILQAFEALIEEQSRSSSGGADAATNFRCIDCEGCGNCRFCTACVDCNDCTYCDACVECDGCTQSRACYGSIKTSHSNMCAQCEGCAYVTLCFDCEDCVQCFACVGLSGEEFCILNEVYKRSDYLRKVAELKTELEALVLGGWRPSWATPQEAPVSEPDPALDPAPEPEEQFGDSPPLERTGTWPPPSAEAAREIDRHQRDDHDLWAALDEHGAEFDRPASEQTGELPPLEASLPPPDPDPAPEPEPAPPPRAKRPAEEGPTSKYPVVDGLAPPSSSIRRGRRPQRPQGGSDGGVSLRSARRPRRPKDPS